MNTRNTTLGAYFFDILTDVAKHLKKAERKNQSFEANEVPTLDAAGNPNGGLDIHIRIHPPGVELPKN